jgi:hypothetical protein
MAKCDLQILIPKIDKNEKYANLLISLSAKVAELADAPGSGLGGRKAIRVQIPSFAPEY